MSFFSENGKKGSMDRLPSCGACGLYKNCKSPKMPPTGKGEKNILIIAEAPGENEDVQGMQLIGESGQLLRRTLRKFGINLDNDCRKTNAVSCRTPDNRTPENYEIDACRVRVLDEIKRNKPRLILLLGTTALTSFLGHRWKKDLGTISRWRGFTIPDRELNAWVCPIYHPSYILHSKQTIVEKIFEQDIEQALKLLDTPVYRPVMGESASVNLLENEADILHVLKMTYEMDECLVFDYETTGLKPHASGHEIVTCAFSPSSADAAYAFVMPKEGPVRVLWRKILMEPRIKKMAHNMKFEDNWTEVRLPGMVQGWHWDSMLAAHIIDNREGITSLKFQAFVNFGLFPWDEQIEPYLKADPKDVKKYGSNAFNKVHLVPIKDLLIYNGIDALVEKRLARIQMAKLGFMEGIHV